MLPLLIQNPVCKLTEQEFYEISQPWPLVLFARLQTIPRKTERPDATDITALDHAACPSRYPANP